MSHDASTTRPMTHTQGFNFCNGAPVTGGERLELCYFPAHGGGRPFEGPGGSDSTSPCVEGNFARVRCRSRRPAGSSSPSPRLTTSSPPCPRRTLTSPSHSAVVPTSAGETASTTASSRRRAWPSTSRRRTPPSGCTTSTTRAERWSSKDLSSLRRSPPTRSGFK